MFCLCESFGINAWKQFQSQLSWRVPAVLAVTHLVVTLTKLGFKAPLLSGSKRPDSSPIKDYIVFLSDCW